MLDIALRYLSTVNFLTLTAGEAPASASFSDTKIRYCKRSGSGTITAGTVIHPEVPTLAEAHGH